MRIALVAMLLLAIAGCGGGATPGPAGTAASTAPSATPSASPEASASAVASPSADASGSTAPSAIAGTLCTAGGSPATGADLTLTDPGIAAKLPDGWQEMDIELYGQLLAQAAAQVNDPRVNKAAEWQAGLIESGVMRVAAAGNSEPSGAQAVILFSVLPVTGDLKTTVDFRLNDESMNGIPIRIVEVGPTELPIGPAYCAGQYSDIDIGTASQTIEYFALEPGGRVIFVGGTAPVGDGGFPDVVRSVALSFAAG